MERAIGRNIASTRKISETSSTAYYKRVPDRPFTFENETGTFLLPGRSTGKADYLVAFYTRVGNTPIYTSNDRSTEHGDPIIRFARKYS